MTKQEWLLERKTGIGASEIASIMGIGYNTDADVYLDKINPEVKEIPDNDNMRRGREREADVCQLFANDHPTYQVIQDDGFVLTRHPERPYCFATPDRHVAMPVKNDSGEDAWEFGVLEVKHTRRYDAYKWKKGEIPQDYFCQVQWQLYCTCRQVGFFAWIHEETYSDGHTTEEFHWLRIERDEEFVQMMVGIADDFWLNKVLPRVPPDSVPVSIEANKTALRLCKSLRSMAAKRLKAAAKEKAVKERLQKYMGEATVLTHEGKDVVTWKYTKDVEQVDLVQLKADYPEAYAACLRKKKGSRVLNVIAEKEGDD